jgi:predicted nucleic acid-binding protein
MILLDNSGLLALHDASEPRHREARDRFDSGGPKLVPSCVLAEFVALIHARGLRRAPALAFLDALVSQPDVHVVWVDESLYRAAMNLLNAHLDKTWSLCDATCFVVMGQANIAEALTTDRHFEQAGFIRLLRP